MNIIEPQTEARSALEQANAKAGINILLEQAIAGKLPTRPYHFVFLDDVLVDVRESEEGRLTREYTDPKMAQEARKRLREAQAAEAIPEGAKFNRRARRGILARTKAHIRKKGREMYLRGKKQERQALKGGQ